MRWPIFFLAAAITMTGRATAKLKASTPVHPFRLIRMENPEPKKLQGIFLFTNTTGKALRVSGFDSPEDGEFQIRFTEYQFQTRKGWQGMKIGYCGTGAKSFVLQPGHTYTIREWLFPYTWLSDQVGGATVGRISLPTLPGYPKIWSQPFPIPQSR